MRGRMERLVVLPFSAGCISQASVDIVGDLHQPAAPRSLKPAPPMHHHSRSSITQEEDEDGESLSSGDSSKNSFRLTPSPKSSNISAGFHRLLKTFKNISQLFEYKEEVEDMEIEIGYPTDVKHVTHIGLDGCAASNPMIGNNWDSLIGQSQDQFLNLPAPNSLRQLHLSMPDNAPQHVS